ncbi:hypothetical protein GCM10022419_122820 [Nonomuraea rosea]|uniref:XRE family transcriptional regulator n=1 Tax=Nonomuraea rosea TaxID=638574 RepID=A0ABP6ZRC2_9ACTN
MSGEGNRVLLRARAWSKRLRSKGFTWDQVAEVLALTHTVSPLRLYRPAHGRTAADVVSVVNDADPAGTASLRESRLYDFEAWPGRGPPRAIGAEETDVKRRELLFELALVLGGAPALDLLRVLTPDEEERLAGVLRKTWRVDEMTARTFEKLTLHARRADDQTADSRSSDTRPRWPWPRRFPRRRRGCRRPRRSPRSTARLA